MDTNENAEPENAEPENAEPENAEPENAPVDMDLMDLDLEAAHLPLDMDEALPLGTEGQRVIADVHTLMSLPEEAVMSFEPVGLCVADFQPYMNQEARETPGDLGNLEEVFNVHQFRCKDGTPVPPELVENARAVHALLVKIMRKLQAQFGEKFGKLTCQILSAYRTPSRNKGVKGKPDSRHLTMDACDFRVPELPRQALAADLVAVWQNSGQIEKGGVGWYNTFTHVDRRGAGRRWDERTKAPR